MDDFDQSHREHVDEVVAMSSRMNINLMVLREFMLQIDSLEWRISHVTESELLPFSDNMEEYLRRATSMLGMLRDQLEYLDHIRLGHECVIKGNDNDLV